MDDGMGETVGARLEEEERAADGEAAGAGAAGAFTAAVRETSLVGWLLIAAAAGVVGPFLSRKCRAAPFCST